MNIMKLGKRHSCFLARLSMAATVLGLTQLTLTGKWEPASVTAMGIRCSTTSRISYPETKLQSWFTRTPHCCFWARPSRALRFNFDFERANYDNVIVRISPRKESRYRMQTTYAPRPWAVLGGSINILQDANANLLTNYLGNNRNYGFTASLAPRERFGLDLAYNYNDVIQNALICFNDTPPTGVSLPFVANAASCAANDAANPLLANSFYTNHTNFGMAAFRVKPVRRATANLGYSITKVDGSIPQFNILQSLGSSQCNYYQPVANLSVDLGHKLAWNNGWNYYQYNEGSFVGPTAPRYFRANALTESLRYAF